MTSTAQAIDGSGEISEGSDKLKLLPLIALVVGSMIGGGVFNLPSDMSRGASPGAIGIGWRIIGFGLLILAFVYQNLAVRLLKAIIPLVMAAGIAFGPLSIAPAQAQSTEADASAEADKPALLTPEELEVLVARVALYPDDLIAVIVAASLEPLQVVQAQRFLESKKTKSDLKPDSKWAGSIVSLLNYPEIVKMMNDDLDWVEELGTAVANQEQEVLAAIQQLREHATASGVLKGNEKVVVEKANDKVIVKSKDPEVVYVPSYDPEILTDPNYVFSEAAPPVYYSDPYPSYYYPTAGFWAGAITGVAWAAAVDWNDGHFWGGDVDVDVDVHNIDKVRNDFRDGKNKDSFNRDKFKNQLESNNGNRLGERARDTEKQTGQGKRLQEQRNARKSKESGLKEQRHGGERAKQADRQRTKADRKVTDRKPARAVPKRQDPPSASKAKRQPQQTAKQKGQRRKSTGGERGRK